MPICLIIWMEKRNATANRAEWKTIVPAAVNRLILVQHDVLTFVRLIECVTSVCQGIFLISKWRRIHRKFSI